MTTTADAQKITRNDGLREFETFAKRVRADGLHFKFEDVTTTDSYAAVALTQVDKDGDTIGSDDPRYVLADSAETVNKPGLVNICLDAYETGGSNAVDVKIQVRNVGASTWQDLSNGEETGISASGSAQVFDDVDGHAQLQVLIKANSGGSQGDVSGYLHIS